MDTQVLCDFAPTDWHLPLRLLGRHQWLRVSPKRTAGGATESDVVGNTVASVLTPLGADYTRTFRRNLAAAGDRAIPFYAASRLAAAGPKIIRLSAAQAESLCQVDVGLTLAEYRQPFPALIVEFPDDFALGTIVEMDCSMGMPEMVQRMPKRALVFHDEEQQFLVVVLGNGDGSITWLTVLDPTEKIEEKLRRPFVVDEFPTGGAAQKAVAVTLERIAINAALVLTQYRSRLAFEHPLKVQELKRDAAKMATNPRRALRAEERLANEAQIITFEQGVLFHDEERPTSAHGTPAGRCVRPHWRRGHWRRQSCGIGRLDHRLIFIRPLLIRADRFAGDIADTAVAYRL